jgi:membrane-associated phospholipid phosphatase
MPSWDVAILWQLIHLADSSRALSKLVVAIYGDGLKTGLIAAMLWWAWFLADGDRGKDNREKVTAGLVASLAGVILVRLLVMLLPFRVRPISDFGYGFHFPLAEQTWANWSSFPSDNAVLFFALTTCLFSVSRVLGVFALLDTVCFICFPRVFLGVHYPSDILAGAVIGVGLGLLVLQKNIRNAISAPALHWMRVHAASFYACFFLLNYLMTQTFWPVVRILMLIRKSLA